MSRGNRNGQPLLVAALVCAGLAAVFAYLHLAGRAEPAADAPEAARVPVVVASQEIRPGTVVRAEMLAAGERAPGQAPPTALQEPTQAVGRVSARPLAAGEVLTQEAVLEASSVLGPAYVLPARMRAITVATDSVAGIAGFLKPGDRVDVFATFTRDQESVTRLVLQDLEVLAVGAETQPPPPPGQPPGQQEALERGRAVAVTLAVTVPEAERLVLADSQGKIRLALRPAAGGYTSHTRGVTVTEVSGLRTRASAPASPAPAPRPAPPEPPRVAVAPPPAKPEPPPAPPPPPHEVLVVRGTRVETVSFPAPGKGGGQIPPPDAHPDGEVTPLPEVIPNADPPSEEGRSDEDSPEQR